MELNILGIHNASSMKKYVSKFNGYTNTFFVGDYHRFCVIQFDDIPFLEIHLPYETELNPDLFRKHLDTLRRAINLYQFYYYEHGEHFIRFPIIPLYGEIPLKMPYIVIQNTEYKLPRIFNTENIYNDIHTKLTFVHKNLNNYINNLYESMIY
jgi:hypothetical protein